MSQTDLPVLPASTGSLTTEQFQKALRNAAWTLKQFCETLGLEPDDYARYKFSSFGEMVHHLCQFDPVTLDKLVQNGRRQQ